MSDQSPVPAWFVEPFQKALTQLGWKLVRWQDKGAILLNAEGDESYFGLGNVLRKVANAPEHERYAKILEHFGNLDRIVEVNSLPAVRERLFPRLRTPVDDDEAGSQMWSMPFQDTGLICTMVVDQPTNMTFVTKSLIDKSGRPAEDWWRLAVDNLRVTSSKDQVVDVDESGLLGIGTADSYDAARALLLAELAPPDPRGHLASIPNRDRFFFYPIGANPFDKRFVRLLIQTLEEHQRGPYSIVDTLFWVHEGKWHVVDWQRDEEGDLSVSPPPELEDLFEQEE